VCSSDLRCPSCGGHLIDSSARSGKPSSKCQACQAEVTVTGSTHVRGAALPKATTGITIRDRSDEKRKKGPVKTAPSSIASDATPIQDRAAALKIIRQALADRVLLSFNYVDKNGTATFRIVEPYKLIKSKGAIVLFGYCLEKTGIRQFAFGNMLNLKTQTSFFEPRWPIEDGLESNASDY
jgi:predicted DNA-binding transcriptional regulator YafY